MSLFNKNKMNPDDVLLCKVVLAGIAFVIFLIAIRHYSDAYLMAEYMKAHSINIKPK